MCKLTLLVSFNTQIQYLQLHKQADAVLCAFFNGLAGRVGAVNQQPLGAVEMRCLLLAKLVAKALWQQACVADLTCAGLAAVAKQKSLNFMAQLVAVILLLPADAGVPIVPTIVWGGQRVYTKGVKPNLKRAKTPVTVLFGQPISYQRNVDIDVAVAELRGVMSTMLGTVQENYPDSHVGKRWAPARLGGTAPAPLN